jgi:hypothetical protein
MRYRHLIRRFPLRKILMLLSALFIAWSWYVQKPAPAPVADEPRIEYLWA